MVQESPALSAIPDCKKNKGCFAIKNFKRGDSVLDVWGRYVKRLRNDSEDEAFELRYQVPTGNSLYMMVNDPRMAAGFINDPTLHPSTEKNEVNVEFVETTRELEDPGKITVVCTRDIEASKDAPVELWGKYLPKVIKDKHVRQAVRKSQLTDKETVETVDLTDGPKAEKANKKAKKKAGGRKRTLGLGNVLRNRLAKRKKLLANETKEEREARELIEKEQYDEQMERLAERDQRIREREIEIAAGDESEEQNPPPPRRKKKSVCSRLAEREQEIAEEWRKRDGSSHDGSASSSSYDDDDEGDDDGDSLFGGDEGDEGTAEVEGTAVTQGTSRSKYALRSRK